MWIKHHYFSSMGEQQFFKLKVAGSNPAFVKCLVGRMLCFGGFEEV